jgi:transposase
LGDKAYSSGANRELLRGKRIKVVIAQPADQIAHRQRRGSAGGRPPDFDAATYKGRNVVERSFNDHKQWRWLATRYDKLATVYRGSVVLRHRAVASPIGRHALVALARVEGRRGSAGAD